MSEMTEDWSVMEMLLNNLESSLVTEIHSTNVELPLDHKEIINAIHSMRNGKAPDPDG